MLEESSHLQWDPIYIDRAPSNGLRIYLLFLLVSCIVTSFNLARVWRAVPPFSTKSPADAAAYIKLLQVSANRFIRWSGLILLASCLLISMTVYDTCRGMLEEKTTALVAIVPAIQGFAEVLNIGMLVIIFLYLGCWHVLSRLERRSVPGAAKPPQFP